MARKKTKKTTVAAAPVTASADPGRDALQSAPESAPRPAQTAKKRPQSPSPAAPGMVRRGTLIFSVILSLLGGVYVGSLLPGLLHAPAPTAAQAPASPPQQATQQTAEQAAPQSVAERIRQLEQHLGHKDDDVESWVQLGNLYFDSAQSKNAIRAYERALILKPDNPDVLTDLGIMYRDEKRYDLAADAFRKATKINPKHQNALFNRGVVLFFDLGRKDEAREVWRQLLAVNPTAKTPDGRSVRDMLQQLK